MSLFQVDRLFVVPFEFVSEIKLRGPSFRQAILSLAILSQQICRKKNHVTEAVFGSALKQNFYKTVVLENDHKYLLTRT